MREPSLLDLAAHYGGLLDRVQRDHDFAARFPHLHRALARALRVRLAQLESRLLHPVGGKRGGPR
ncbi:hypothetical protein Srot_2122 [Segniliparus rotundus DSM 44985]|uniref:Uncharacterized protein n=1 Tax=Segniliparus rotundus (strain ATCC BAA-972 / CDC 1076 / CIP 108378 / DSM 44985 / JCM 13578) TaxID=640132 RepID=D6Z9E5_SEGRD|nr:hypothetical protein [Segniliparus rotundus]ADG98575.1 hypothetical protein Srot_2122 [Segniliparus rotundus DSM 44985]